MCSAIGFAARTATSHKAAEVPRRAPHGGLGLPTRLRADNRRFWGRQAAWPFGVRRAAPGMLSLDARAAGADQDGGSGVAAADGDVVAAAVATPVLDVLKQDTVLFAESATSLPGGESASS
jgi:hypothetical protein